MTPQEKAKQLFEKFLSEIPWSDYDYPEVTAKQCALIAVDEIMKSYEDTNSHHGTVYNYWQQVKEEIQKL